MSKESSRTSAAGRDHVNELRAILGRFIDARCVLECAVRSLEQWQHIDDAEAAERRSSFDPEIVCLRHSLRLLANVYDEFDSAIAAFANGEGPVTQ